MIEYRNLRIALLGALELGAEAISGLRRDASADGRLGRRVGGSR